MSETKFTPGPWAADHVQTECDEFPYHSYAVYDAQGRVIVDATNSQVGEIHQEGPDEDGHVDRWDEQGRRNCTAIAALPELWQALKAASHALRSYQHGNTATDLAAEVADFADAALAKAEGRK